MAVGRETGLARRPAPTNPAQPPDPVPSPRPTAHGPRLTLHAAPALTRPARWPTLRAPLTFGARRHGEREGASRDMRITDLKCAVIGQNPVVRVVTDEGISGYGEVESYKPYLKPHVLYYKPFIVGEDPTD